MSLLLLFAYPNPASIPIGELVTTPPSASNGFAIQQPATAGEWRWVVELADPADGTSAIWRDITTYYVGDRHQFGADTYKGDARARLVQVQLQIDDSDMLAPWGQDTSSIFGVDVRLDAGMLMRASFARVDTGVVVEWLPIWTGRVESWGDESGARGQVRRHVVSVVDTIADLANVPTVVLSAAATWPEYVENQLLPAAGWLFGVDIYGDAASSGGPFDDVPQAAVNRLDGITDFQGLVWRSLRAGRLVIHPAPWDTTNVDRYDNPLLDFYPDGLKFSYSPDFTDIEYIADDDQQPFGIERTVAGIINFITITYPGDLGPEVYATDDPVSIGRYGVRPMSASWIGWNGPQTVEDILDDRAFASSQALPLRTTLDHEGFWSAMAIVDHLDPVTIVHATSDEGLVVTATGTVRNIVEERTFRGEAGGDYALSWQSTVQVDLDATETSPALLPVEDLAFISSESSGSAGPSTAEFTWTNPTQPDVTPTEVQMRVLGRSFIWSSEDYPGVGADGTTINWLEAGQYYTLQVRLIRRVNGIIVAASAIRQVRFFTPNRIFPIPIPGTDPGDTDVIGEPPDDDCDDFQIDLQENDGTGWVTVDTFTGAELTDNGDGTFSLTTPIDNSFFNVGSMYRFRSSCDGVDWIAGTAFDPPDDWSDPCTTPPALSDPPFSDASLLVYVPKVCAPDIIREAVSGLEAVHGGALEAIVSGVGDPEDRALLALADPAWSDAAGGILAYGGCPQIVGHVGDRTMSVRVKVVDAVACVLFECGGMRITCVPTTGGWRAAVIVYKVGLTITLPTTTVLDEGTAYVISATHELATGNITIAVDGVQDNSVAGTDNVNIIAALPIWRVGAPPESWITDCALWDEVLTIGNAYAAEVMSDTPLVYWRLEETSGTTVTDYSGNGYDAGLYIGAAAPTINQIGQVDRCYLFDDANSQGFWRNTNDLWTAMNGTSFTAEAWVRQDAAKDNNTIVAVDNNDPSVGQRSWLFHITAAQKLEFIKLPNTTVTVTGTTTLALNTWYHVAATYDGSNIRLYINGVLEATGAATGSIKGTGVVQFTNVGWLGRTGGNFYMSGNIDEVAIYTSVLSAARLLAHYNAA